MSRRPEHPSRIVVVTGASSGIGRAAAVAFAALGDTVVLAARSVTSLQAAAAECRSVRPGAVVLVVPTDVTDEEAVRALCRRTVERFGRVDVWVEAAAVMAYGRIEDLPSDLLRRVLETDILGPLHAARAVLPLFRKQGAGTLVIVGSLLSRITTPYMGAYVMSKWSVRGLTRVLQQELRDAPGVSVCTVHPPGVNTPIYLQAANYIGRRGRPPIPVQSPERIARAILRSAARPRRRREVLLGVSSPVIVAGFLALPRVYDALVGPLLSVGGLSRERVEPTSGNVFAPRPALDAMHGPWRRHWLRGPVEEH